MTELEKLKERKEQIEDQLNRTWFKHKLKREPTDYQRDWPDVGKWSILDESCSDIIEEYKALGGVITELEHLERERRIAAIWDETD